MALNSDNTKINESFTAKINSINVVDLYRSKEAFQSLFRIVEDIIESPNKAHHRDYWIHITEFETKQQEMALWSVENKVKALKEKRARAKNYKSITSK